MDNGTESTYAYYRQCERLQDMLLTANGASIMETQYKYALIDNILGISNVITPNPPNRREGVRAGQYGWHGRPQCGQGTRRGGWIVLLWCKINEPEDEFVVWMH